MLACGCGARSELLVEDNYRGIERCGDGDVSEDEQCDLGDDNEDRPAIELLNGVLRRAVMPVDRSESVLAFYDYASESSHTGFEERTTSRMFLYRDRQTARMSLILHHGIDEDSSGQTLTHGEVEMDLSGIPEGAGVELADDNPDEMLLVGADGARGRWEFWRNSDGAVIGPVPLPGDWTIRITTDLRDGIESWDYVDADGEPIELTTQLDGVLRAFPTPSRCRLDCTVPRCGDGIVDGGEICDDGNLVEGDGCSPDCATLDGL
jgi:cysteine-rich repeat protein